MCHDSRLVLFLACVHTQHMHAYTNDDGGKRELSSAVCMIVFGHFMNKHVCMDGQRRRMCSNVVCTGSAQRQPTSLCLVSVWWFISLSRMCVCVCVCISYGKLLSIPRSFSDTCTVIYISFVYSVEIHTTTPSFVMTFWNSLAMTFACANIFFNTLHYRCWLPYDSFIICLLYSFNLVLRCRWKICPYMNDIMRFITNAQCSYTQSMSSMLHSNCCCAIILKMFQQFVCWRIYRVTVCMMPELKTTLISDVGISYVCSNYSNFNCWKWIMLNPSKLRTRFSLPLLVHVPDAVE